MSENLKMWIRMQLFTYMLIYLLQKSTKDKKGKDKMVKVNSNEISVEIEGN